MRNNNIIRVLCYITLIISILLGVIYCNSKCIYNDTFLRGTVYYKDHHGVLMSTDDIYVTGILLENNKKIFLRGRRIYNTLYKGCDVLVNVRYKYLFGMQIETEYVSVNIVR